jgi:LmbE family N-acetylglucosaminyl deacetylase
VLSLKLGSSSGPPTILCLGAHCDDIEIGCGASLLRWVREYPQARIVWAVFSREGAREQETHAAAGRLLAGAGSVELRFHDFRSSYFPGDFSAIKAAVEELKSFSPDLVLTHHRGDRHQDHELLANLTWNTFRSHLVLEYEIAKYEGDLGHPNFYVPCTAEDLARKVDTLMECFPSQRARSWFTHDTFRALARLRGIECAAATGFAEAFHAPKVSL